MRMLRWGQIVLGLTIVVVIGVVVGRLGDSVRQEDAILERSNTLVSKEVGATYTPYFLSQAIENGPEYGIWVVSGQIVLLDSSDRQTRDEYVAVIRQVCSAQMEKKCWALESLTLGGEESTVAAANATPGGTVTVNGVASGDRPSDREVRQSTETEIMPKVEPYVEEAVHTNGEVPHVDDDDDVAGDAAVAAVTADAPEVPKAVGSKVEIPAATAIEVSVVNTGNDVSKIVYLIQDRLNRLGYAKPALLELDGRFGPRTHDAISVYQRAHGLKIDGRASRELLYHIEGRAMSPAQVAELQVPTPESVAKGRWQGRFRVQLGVFSSSEAAPKLWRALQTRHSDLLGGLEHQISPVSDGDRGVVHYLYAGPLPTASSANSLCHTLAQRNVNCQAVAP